MVKVPEEFQGVPGMFRGYLWGIKTFQKDLEQREIAGDSGDLRGFQWASRAVSDGILRGLKVFQWISKRY